MADANCILSVSKSKRMGIFYIFFTLFPCVIGQLQERWLRHTAKKWIMHDATIIQQTLAGVWAPTIEIRYRFDANGESHDNSSYFYPTKNSRTSAPIYEAEIKVLVDPKNSDRSYFLFFCSGFLHVPIVAVAILALFGGLYSGLEQRRFDATSHPRIRMAEYSRWSACSISSFLVTLLTVGTASPVRWLSRGAYPCSFRGCVGVRGLSSQNSRYEYREPPVPDKAFALIRNQFIAGSGTSQVVERPLVYTSVEANLKAGHPIMWRGSTGRLFGYSQPGSVTEMYVSGRDVYVISTNWQPYNPMCRFSLIQCSR